MSITLTLGDFLAIAAIVLIFARGAQTHAGRDTRRELRMERQMDAIMSHLGLPEPPVSRHGALSPQVSALIEAGRATEAILLYRQETGESMKSARAAVELGRTAASAKHQQRA